MYQTIKVADWVIERTRKKRESSIRKILRIWANAATVLISMHQ
ncbi:hypothetical protein [Bacillus atrophaeus]|nr:hypothetical protein [Bacillus atrophaeus]